jgi:NitT/TauT family transport system permease protein
VITRDRVVPPLLALAAFLAGWQLLVSVGNYPTFILPGPVVVGQKFVAAWADGTMAPHVVTTLAEIGLANRVASPYLVAAQAVPILALAPLMALWFGSGLFAHALIVALIVFFPVAISTVVAVQGVDRRLLEMARSYRVTRGQRLRMIELPAALPGILGGLRIGVTLSVVGAIVAEWTGGETGLGVLINLARGSLFDIPLLFATLLTIALIGVALYSVVVLVERRYAIPAA